MLLRFTYGLWQNFNEESSFHRFLKVVRFYNSSYVHKISEQVNFINGKTVVRCEVENEKSCTKLPGPITNQQPKYASWLKVKE